MNHQETHKKEKYDRIRPRQTEETGHGNQQCRANRQKMSRRWPKKNPESINHEYMIGDGYGAVNSIQLISNMVSLMCGHEARLRR